MTYVDRLSDELWRVGIHGRARARILIEAADHLTQGEESEFGDPRELAQLFADEYATQATARAAYVALAALALTAAAFAAAWISWVTPHSKDITSAASLPIALAAGFGMIAFPQISFTAGLLAFLRAWRMARLRAAPAAELAVVMRRTNVALAFGAAAMAAVTAHALNFGFSTLAAAGCAATTLPLVAAGLAGRRAAAIASSVPGPAGDMFDDLPISLPRRPWLACLSLAAALGLLLLVGGGVTNEGPRNAIAEIVLVVGSFAVLGRRLGLRD